MSSVAAGINSRQNNDLTGTVQDQACQLESNQPIQPQALTLVEEPT